MPKKTDSIEFKLQTVNLTQQDGMTTQSSGSRPRAIRLFDESIPKLDFSCYPSRLDSSIVAYTK